MKNMIKTLSTFIIYSYIPTLLVLIARNVFNIQLSNSNIMHIVYVNVIVDTLFFITFIILHFDLLKNFKPLNGNTKKERIINFIKTVLIASVIFYGVKIASGIIVTMISMIFDLKTTSANQEALETAFKSAPWLMVLTGVVFAPVVEELVFRGAVRKVIKNKWVFVIVSGLLFGLVHVLNTNLPIIIILITGIIINYIYESEIPKKRKSILTISTCFVMMTVMLLSLHVVSGDLVKVLTSMSPSEALNSITYIIAGVYLALVYVKYDNIYVTIGCHMMNNLVAYIMLFTLG